MDEKRLLSLRMIWGAVTFSTLLFFGIITFVIAPVSAAEAGDGIPTHYVLMAAAFGLAAAFYVLRTRKNTLADSPPAEGDAAQRIFSLSIVCFALAEAVGLLGGISILFGAPFTVGIGLLGIALIFFAMEFPKGA